MRLASRLASRLRQRPRYWLGTSPHRPHAAAHRSTASTSFSTLPALTVFTHPSYTLALPERHSFPMNRYELVAEAVRGGSTPSARIAVRNDPRRATMDELERAHDQYYLADFVAGDLSVEEVRAIGFPWSDALVERTLRITGATLEATLDVLVDAGENAAVEEQVLGDDDDLSWIAGRMDGQGSRTEFTETDTTVTTTPSFSKMRGGWRVSGNLAGGTHHAFGAHGEGFCIVNDVAVAARFAQSQFEHVRNIAVIDLDVHQGNGTADIFADDDSVFTLSVHADNNYPWVGQSRVASDLDIALPDDASPADYLRAVHQGLRELDRQGHGNASSSAGEGAGEGRRPSGKQWDLVFFQAGVDPLESDRLGRLKLGREDLAARNAAVYAWCAERRIPTVITMGGGYARPIERSVEAHRDVFCQAADIAAETRRSTS